MIAALLAVACVSATPTPTFRCDCDGIGIAGFRLYWRHADTVPGHYDGSFDLPSTVLRNEDTSERCLWAPGWQLDYPLQRSIDAEGVEVRITVRPFDAENVEHAPSDELTACLPVTWRPGMRYEP
jgi:hypothetical protein